MKNQNSPSQGNGRPKSTSGHWLWLQSRWENKATASSDLSEWLCQQLDELEGLYASEITVRSRKLSASSLVKNSRRS